jgi:hypothetical protein
MRFRCLGRRLRAADIDADARHTDTAGVVYAYCGGVVYADSDSDTDSGRRLSTRCAPGLWVAAADQRIHSLPRHAAQRSLVFAKTKLCVREAAIDDAGRLMERA